MRLASGSSRRARRSSTDWQVRLAREHERSEARPSVVQGHDCVATVLAFLESGLKTLVRLSLYAIEGCRGGGSDRQRRLLHVKCDVPRAAL